VATGLVFGAYHYTDYLGPEARERPVLIPLAWFMMIYPSYVIANLVMDGHATGTRAGAGWLVRLAAVSAVVMTAWDLVVDPILSGPSLGRGSGRTAARTSAFQSRTSSAGC